MGEEHTDAVLPGRCALFLQAMGRREQKEEWAPVGWTNMGRNAGTAGGLVVDWIERRRETLRRLHDPHVADNGGVRQELLELVESGEMTPAEMGKRLREIQRDAKRAGGPAVYG